MAAKLLIVYISIGDEDGPSLSFYIANYKDYNIKKYINKTVVVNLDDINFDLTKAKYLNCNYNMIIKKYKIIDILEVHDWYDYLTKKQVVKKQKTINECLVISNHKPPLAFIIVVSYNQDPIKYLVPCASINLKHIKSNLCIFGEEDKYQEKQDFSNMMKKYIVYGSYSELRKEVGDFAEHIVIISDEINEKDHIKFD